MNQTDPNFDWVTARAKCSPTDVLHHLESQIEKDISTRNELLTDSEKSIALGSNFNVN
jgi:hypothetical protein